MAKLIFISPYLKGNRNSAQLANHVRYISTRDGVQTLNDGAKNLPPTKKQEEYIQKLTKKFSEAKLLPEYDEYLKAFKRINVNHIPKVYLIEFCSSKYFRTITRKSDWHIRALQEFPRWQVIRGLKT